MQIGGTEVWHQTLIREIDDVAGFVAFEPSLAQGDLSKLDCITGVGLAEAKALAASVDVLVVWGIGAKLGDVLAGLKSPPRVISVSHCDSRSQWTIDMMKAMEPWTDQAVYLCPSGIETVPQRLRDSAVCIPNGPDPERVRTTLSRDKARAQLGLNPSDRCLLVTSRLSAEKRIRLLVDAVHLLPPDYRLFVAGRASTLGDEYAKELAELQNDQFKLLDPVDSPADLLAAADAVLSASDYEGYGLATAEGMLAGVPVISTRTGLLEQLSDAAKIVPHDASAKQWATAIKLDLADRDTQHSRAAKARSAIARECSVASFAVRWRRLLDVAS